MSAFPYQMLQFQFPEIDYSDVIGDMDVTTPGTTLKGAPGGVTWKDKSFLTRGKITHGSSLTPGYKNLMSDSGALAESVYWNAAAPWWTVFPLNVAAEGGDNAVTNCYIKITQIRTYYFSISQQRWIRLGAHGKGIPYMAPGKFNGAVTTSSGPASFIYAKDDGMPAYFPWNGGTQVVLHNPLSPNAEYPSGGIDCGGVFVMCKSQLVSPDNEAFTGGDGIPKYGLAIGVDYYPSTDSATNTAVLAGMTYFQAAGSSKFKRIPADRSGQMHYFVTGIGADTFVDNTSPAYAANGAAGMYMSAAELQAQLPSIELHQTLPIEFFGPQTFVPTPLADGTMWVSTTGSDAVPGTDINNPTSIQEAFDTAVAGDVVFLRGGTYSVTSASNLNMWAEGTAALPIIFEAYPGETVVIDGSTINPGVDTTRYPNISGFYQYFRNIAFKNMPEYGAFLTGHHNRLQFCELSYNRLSGAITYQSGVPPWDPALSSYNLLESCWIHHNSDVGLFGGNYNDGGNADGVSFSTGIGNQALNCLIEHNSDDGADSWRSKDSKFKYCIIRYNGLGNGNGNGVKAGGNSDGEGCIVDHNLVYGNLNNGIDANTGIAVTFSNNTEWDNGGVGYVLESDTVNSRNVSIGSGSTHTGTGVPTGNSWNTTGTPVFVSTDPDSADFLNLAQSGLFTNIGARYV